MFKGEDGPYLSVANMRRVASCNHPVRTANWVMFAVKIKLYAVRLALLCYMFDDRINRCSISVIKSVNTTHTLITDQRSIANDGTPVVKQVKRPP